MKPLITSLACLICIQLFASCNQNNIITGTTNNVLETDSTKMKITISTNTYSAIVYNNPTATAFKAQLPMTIYMTELNGNEKLFYLPNGLPANASNPGAIQTGDLMLYGTNTLVLFYKSFSTSYKYTRIARIESPLELAAAIGTGSTTVKFELE